MKNAVKLSVVSFLLASLAPVIPAQVRHRTIDSQDTLSQALQLLWSLDDTARQSAKEKLVAIGAPAIPLLVSLLEDIYQQPDKKRFPLEMESTGRRKPPQRDAASGATDDLEITARLTSDIVELLGRLRAVEAVPVLIKLMKEPDFVISYNWSITYTMQALIQIGSPAVPQLLDEIETESARINAAESEQNREHREDEIKVLIARKVARIQNKIAIVLGEIGDERALPVLEKLLDPTRHSLLLELEADYVNEALDRIKGASQAR